MKLLILAFVALLLSLSAPAQTVSQLYVGPGRNQPLIVGLGGSEGGNAWASDYWKATRNRFTAQGYAFLALGYFGAPGTPDTLDRIAIDNVHDAIVRAAQDPRIDAKRIAIIGGSRGGDLALLLGSYYKDITCVVALVPSHVIFPGHTSHFTTPAWSFAGQPLPFVPVNEAAVPALMQHDLRGTFAAMLTDTAAEARALIKVERINGPVLLLSATQDEICPSTPMCDKIIARLNTYRFKYPHQHQAISGPHAAPLKHFDEVFAFLAVNFAVAR